MKRSTLLFPLFCMVITACATHKMNWSGANESERINDFFEKTFEEDLKRYPSYLTYLGRKERYGELDDYSDKFQKESYDLARKRLSQLKSFDYSKLNDEAKISYDLYKRETENQIDSYKWRKYNYPVNQMFGLHSQIPSFMMNMHRVSTQQDVKDYISRLNDFKRAMGEIVDNMKANEKAGVVPPKFVFEKVISDSENLIVGRPFDNKKMDAPLFRDFKKKLASVKGIKKGKRNYYIQKAKLALTQSVKPAYENLIAFLKEQEKRSTTKAGVWKFPNGDDFYEHQLKIMTTTDYSPQFIHKLGLMNVDRIHGEMKEIMKKVGYKGSLQDFFKYMKSNRKFFFSQSAAGRQGYLALARKYIGDMRAKLDKLFITKPKAPLKIKAVEKFREDSAGMAFYEMGTPDGSRPGQYYVNLSNIKALPKWEAEALAYHEGIPGHHMQVSIAQERDDIPKFRRFSRITAYTEGWGLYSEKVPKEFGAYLDPYSDFGRLSMELVRACRLVVDTGLHWKKWTREQAIAYLDKNTPGDHDDNIRQINRYIVAPGQATAYMVGMLKILELRRKAKNQLGAKFDIREFHDLVLKNGAVTLGMLEKLVGNYIKSKANTPSKTPMKEKAKGKEKSQEVSQHGPTLQDKLLMGF